MKQPHRQCRDRIPPIYHTLTALLLLTALAAPAHADLATWNLTNVSLGDGGTLTGWFSYDTTGNSITDFNITATFGNTPADFSPLAENPHTFSLSNTFSPVYPFAESSFNDDFIGFESDTHSGEHITYVLYRLNLFIPDTDPDIHPYLSLTEYSPISISSPINGPGWYSYVTVSPTNQIISPSYGDSIATGELTRVVPEPSTLLLLGPGLAGLWVWGRKKFKCI